MRDNWWYIKLVGKIIISGILLYVVVRQLDIQNVIRHLASVRVSLLLVGIGCLSLAQVIGAYKWFILGRDIFQFSFSFLRYLEYFLSGFFYSFFLPGGQLVGEGMKAARMGKGGSFATVLFSQFLDRVTGFIGVGVLMFFVYAASPILRSDSINVLVLFVALGITLFGVFLLTRAGHTSFSFIAWRVVPKRHHVRLGSIIENAAHIATQKKTLTFSVGVACAAHTISALSMFFILKSMGIQVLFLYVIWIYLALGILMVLPISYAGIGLREGAFVYYLAHVGVSAELALSAAVLFFVVQVCVACVGGVLELKNIWRTL